VEQIVMAVSCSRASWSDSGLAAGRSAVGERCARVPRRSTPPHTDISIFALAHWAFVGFESITHAAAEAEVQLKAVS
jgi:amino acid transporter